MCGKLFLFLSLDLDWAEVDSREGSRIPYPKPENQFRAKTINFQVNYTCSFSEIDFIFYTAYRGISYLLIFWPYIDM